MHKHENDHGTTHDRTPGRTTERRPTTSSDPRSPEALLALQRTVGNGAVAAMVTADESPVQRASVQDVLDTSGSPLAPSTRAEFETRLGADFGDVRVHTGADAKQTAAGIGARAYTSGNHIVIGEGGGDKHTLAHELTHVIQQREGPVSGTPVGGGLSLSDPTDAFERAAEATAHAVMRSPITAHTTAHGHDGRLAIQRADTTTTATTILSATGVADQEFEGQCGYFTRVREWQVDNPQTGIIIQKVTRQFGVEKYNSDDGTWTAMSGAGIDAYITQRDSNAYGRVQQYWEAWRVDAQGNVGDGGDDTFSMCSIIPDGRHKVNTTRGWFRMSGTARFYPTTLQPSQLGMARNTVPTAGGLYSSYGDPTGGLAPSGRAVRYTTTVTWDSSHKDTRYSTVTES
jgi:hypothetical protein